MVRIVKNLVKQMRDGVGLMEVKRIFEVGCDLEALAAIAESEGHRSIRVLVKEFVSGENRFQQPGEALFGADVEGELIGVCGLNMDPYETDKRAGRVRRLFVHPAWRRRGAGSELLRHVEAKAVSNFRFLQLFTASQKAAAFYEARGYVRQSRYKVSHGKSWTVTDEEA